MYAATYGLWETKEIVIAIAGLGAIVVALVVLIVVGLAKNKNRL